MRVGLDICARCRWCLPIRGVPCAMCALVRAEEEEHAAREEKDVREERMHHLQVRVRGMPGHAVAPSEQARVQPGCDDDL